MHSTDPTQETRATVDHAGYSAPTREHELDYTDQDTISICPEMSSYHELCEQIIHIICSRCATFAICLVLVRGYHTAGQKAQ